MAATAPAQTSVPKRKGYPIKDESCRIECPECGQAQLVVDHTDEARTWWRCSMQCTPRLIGMDWPKYTRKPYVPTITELEGLT